MPNKRLLIVYHSHTGGTRQMVNAATEGAREAAEVDVIAKQASDARSDDVLAADGFIFASPENLGSMAGLLKDFFDRTYYAALDRLNGRPYAIMICAGSDGHGALQQIQRIAVGWRLREVAAPLIVLTRATAAADIERPKIIATEGRLRCEELGKAFAFALALGIF